MTGHVFVLIDLLLASLIVSSCTVLDTIGTNDSLRDGDTLISAGGDFELGFFSPTNLNTSRYIGIWFSKISAKTVIWVANRDAPLYDTGGALNMTDQGILVLYNSTNGRVWSSNTSATVRDPVALLLNSGNLVIRNQEEKSLVTFWESFDYPCDSFIPGMKLGVDRVTGFQRFLSSWKTSEDPAPGEYTISAYENGNSYPQVVLRKGTTIRYRPGSWNGLTFTGVDVQDIIPVKFVLNETDIAFIYGKENSSIASRSTLNPSGMLQRLIWNERIQDWDILSVVQADQCEVYALCGAFSICNVQNSPICGCLDGFIKNYTENQSLGCVRRTPLNCGEADRFIKYSGVKLPDTFSTWFNESIDLKECKRLCLQNCSCTAYTNLDIRGTGCLLWFNELVDIRVLNLQNQVLYLRVAASEIEARRGSSNKKKLVGIIVSLIIVAFSVLVLGLIIYRRRRFRRKHESKEDLEQPLFSLNTIVEATDNFSSRNKLGEGGFGPVYKGVLVDGQEIAVKRLSKSSGQGLNEFKNEVILIAKLQHRNLVKLLGCCIHEDEKILIYEYMPNRSLDSFIFDETRGKLLDWGKRFSIINGIARGLLYLHQDSRLRIIHRDLKTSNILLDKLMNPKISDFGLARTFGGDQSHANTNRVVGTYGYMSPEYAMDGHFSIKSDVFSFGVLLLEIVSGKKNRGFSHSDYSLNLLGHAWRLSREEREMELLDERLKESCIASEVTRCIHVALLCVQQRPSDRPTMSSVVVMLSRDFQLAKPKHPGFFLETDPHAADTSSNANSLQSANSISMTLLEAR